MVEYSIASAAVSYLREEMLDRVFSALADSTRRRLVHLLAERERTVGELAAPFDMSLAAVSKHLAILERAGLVRRRKDGRTHYCSLRPESLAGGLDWIAIYNQFWRQRFEALAAVVSLPPTRRTWKMHRLELTEILAAPVERVYGAWTDAMELQRWFAPGDQFQGSRPDRAAPGAHAVCRSRSE